MAREAFSILKPAPTIREIVLVVNTILRGAVNVGGDVTFPQASGSMTVTDSRASAQSVITLSPPRLGFDYAIIERNRGSFVLAWSGAAAGDTASYAIIG